MKESKRRERITGASTERGRETKWKVERGGQRTTEARRRERESDGGKQREEGERERESDSVQRYLHRGDTRA